MPSDNDKTGLRYWARTVVDELENLSTNFAADPVHDLRVALRRCRSLADGFVAVDPDPGWKQLKKIGKALFSSLGNLRDIQVMEDWVVQLSETEDPTRTNLLKFFDERQSELKKDARIALDAFDGKRWEALAAGLASHTEKVPLEGLVFQHMALERWTQAHQLHREALRNRTQAALHRVRIGLKKFRYTIENFLPQRHAKWGSDLKELQDLLGEIHDLDVLSAILRTRPDIAPEDRKLWSNRIAEARRERLEKYRAKMVGRHSLWQTWRADLPQGERIQDAALARLQTWASFLDPDLHHSKHVSDLALQLYQGLVEGDLLPASEKDRRILKAAALLHNIGRAKVKRGHHKQSFRMIRKITVPLGWSEEDLSAVAAIARYHRGALPRDGHKGMQQIPASSREAVIRLAGVLRLADGIDCSHDGRIRRLEVERNNGTLVVLGDGYAALGRSAERIAAARYLLESSCDIAVSLRPATENKSTFARPKAELRLDAALASRH